MVLLLLGNEIISGHEAVTARILVVNIHAIDDVAVGRDLGGSLRRVILKL